MVASLVLGCLVELCSFFVPLVGLLVGRVGFVRLLRAEERATQLCWPDIFKCA